jgi:hypothetical protein
MPPQKNSGNRGAKRETGASVKNRKFVQNFLEDLRSEGAVEHVHLGRVIRRLGDGRMEVFYAQKLKNDQRGKTAQAKIPGKFSGRGKHSVWIDVGTFVAIGETGVAGAAAFEIVAVFTPEQMRDIAQEFNIDARVMAVDNTDGAQLVANKMSSSNDPGFDFMGVADEDIEIDDI